MWLSIYLLMCLRDICISPLNDRKVFLSLYHKPGLLVTRPMTRNKTERHSGLYQARSAVEKDGKQTDKWDTRPASFLL